MWPRLRTNCLGHKKAQKARKKRFHVLTFLGCFGRRRSLPGLCSAAREIFHRCSERRRGELTETTSAAATRRAVDRSTYFVPWRTERESRALCECCDRRVFDSSTDRY